MLVARHGLSLSVSSPKLSHCSPPGPTYRCPFTEPINGFRSTCGHSSGFISNSVALESTEISRHRPRLPSVTTDVLSMGTWLIVTVEPLYTRCDFNWYTVKSTFALTEDVVLRSCTWQMLVVYASLLTQKATFRTGYRHRYILCPAAKNQTAHASNPNNQRKEILRNLEGPLPLQCLRNFLEVLVSWNQDKSGNGGIVSVDSSEDSSAATSSSMVSPAQIACSSSSQFLTPLTWVRISVVLH